MLGAQPSQGPALFKKPKPGQQYAHVKQAKPGLTSDYATVIGRAEKNCHAAKTMASAARNLSDTHQQWRKTHARSMPATIEQQLINNN